MLQNIMVPNFIFEDQLFWKHSTNGSLNFKDAYVFQHTTLQMCPGLIWFGTKKFHLFNLYLSAWFFTIRFPQKIIFFQGFGLWFLNAAYVANMWRPSDTFFFIVTLPFIFEILALYPQSVYWSFIYQFACFTKKLVPSMPNCDVSCYYSGFGDYNLILL